MPPALLARLAHLLTCLDSLETEAAAQSEIGEDPTQDAFHMGLTCGLEIARSELASIVAEAMQAATGQL